MYSLFPPDIFKIVSFLHISFYVGSHLVQTHHPSLKLECFIGKAPAPSFGLALSCI